MLRVSKPLFTRVPKHPRVFFHLPLLPEQKAEQRPGELTDKHQPCGTGETDRSETRFSARLNLRDVSHSPPAKPMESLVCKMGIPACKDTCSLQNILFRSNILSLNTLKLMKWKKTQNVPLTHGSWKEPFHLSSQDMDPLGSSVKELFCPLHCSTCTWTMTF